MKKDIIKIIDLVNSKTILENKLKNLLCGTIELREIKGSKYIYLHKREAGIYRTKYVDVYNEELYNSILNNNIEAKEIKKKLRDIKLKLKQLDYKVQNLSEEVKLNIDFAKKNLVSTIYKQAVMEGVAVTFLDTETIIEGGKINGISAADVQKINNLKHAWQLILDEDVISSKADFNLLCLINKLVDEGFYYNAGLVRSIPVSIGGTVWKPPLPVESVIKENLELILNKQDVDIYEKAINSLLYITKAQVFIDGNKRTSIIFANHLLISHGAGLLVIPEELINDYKKLLIKFYETDNKKEIYNFILNNCVIKLK